MATRPLAVVGSALPVALGAGLGVGVVFVALPNVVAALPLPEVGDALPVAWVEAPLHAAITASVAAVSGARQTGKVGNFILLM